MLITNDNGDLEWATIEDIVQGNETVTTLVDNLDGTYTYTSEDGTVTVIDVPASVVENFESIYNQIVNEEITVHGDTYNTFEEYLESIVTSLSTNIEGSPFINVTGTGTIADPYVVSIEEGDANSMLITNDNGDLEWATIEDIVQGNETVTTLVDNLDGTYTYTSEDGTVTVIDVPASVVENFENIYNQIVNEEITVNGDTYNTFEEYLESIVTSLSTNIEGSPFINVSGSGTATDPYVVSIEGGDANSMLITNDNGDLEWATIEDIVQANETVTDIADNGDGTYTYTNEEGDTFVIDVPASVVENFETIVNSGPVNINGEDYNTIEEYITYLANTSINLEGSEFINITGSGTDTDPYVVAIEGGTENTMLITDANGDVIWATIEDIVQGSETVTTLVDNLDGTYTYTSEDGTVTVIDVPASVVENFESIYNQIVNEEITVHGDTYNTFEEYLESIVTSLSTNIEEGDANSMLITNDNGDLEWATIEDIVQGNETVTDIADNGDGTYTYTNEEGDTFVIDVPASVVENFETIVNSGPVNINGEDYTTIEEYITYLANTSINLEGSEFINITGSGTDTDPYVVAIEGGTENTMLITDANGDVVWTTIEDIVQANETVTDIADNGDGTYTYTNEEGDTFVIDVPASVVENFESIYNQIVNEEITVHGDTYNTFEEYLESIVTSLSTNIDGSPFINVSGSGTATDPYVVSIEEGNANLMLITNDNGDLEWATIEDIVQGNETVTDIADNGDGTYTYTNEEGDTFVIDVPASVVENFETIVNSGPVNINGEDYTTIEEYITYLANTSINLVGSEFINITGSGTDTDPYVVVIEGGTENTMLITDANGDVVWATIEDIVQGNETVTTLVDNLDEIGRASCRERV